jgi:hypothetical protein
VGQKLKNFLKRSKKEEQEEKVSSKTQLKKFSQQIKPLIRY